MDSDNLNNSFNENELLNDVNIDPTLPAVPAGGNNEQGGQNDENGVIEQVSIQDLVQRMNVLTQSMEARDDILLRRLAALEQNSSRGSQASTVSTANTRPNNNRFGIAQDHNGGNFTLNEVSANGNSPSYSNVTAPSAANSNPSGPRPDSRQRDRRPPREEGRALQPK